VRTGLIALLAAIAVSCLACGAALAADATFSIDWANQPLSVVLDTLNKHFGVNYVLPAELGNRKVSANLMNVTPERALKTVVTKAGLLAQLRSGTWMISAPQAGPAVANAYAQMGPEMGGPGGFPGMVAPPDPSMAGGLGAPGMGAGFGGGRTGRTGRFGGQAGTQSTQEQEGPRNYQIVPVRRIDPALVADIFGGDVIYGGGSDSGSSSSGSSGYGRNSSSDSG